MWWFGKVVTWRETVYLVILLAGAVWGAVRLLKAKKEQSPQKNKVLSALYIFLGFASALVVYVFHVIADVSAARAAMYQGLENAPPIPLWGSLRVFEWSLLIAGAVISVLYGIKAQSASQRSVSDENQKDDSIFQS